MDHRTTRPVKYTVTTNKRKLDVRVIHGFLRQSYWAEKIPRSIVERSIKNSLCFGVFNGKEQVGFARVVTDYATFGYVADVFVTPKHQGRGLGKLIVKSILAHPKLQTLRRFLLATRDAHGLYKQFGFKHLPGPKDFLTIASKNFYIKHPTLR